LGAAVAPAGVFRQAAMARAILLRAWLAALRDRRATGGYSVENHRGSCNGGPIECHRRRFCGLL